jgi:hypothetical protein
MVLTVNSNYFLTALFPFRYGLIIKYYLDELQLQSVNIGGTSTGFQSDVTFFLRGGD